MESSDSSPPNIYVSPAEVQFLRELLDGEVQRYRALVELANLAETGDKKDQGVGAQPLVERLNEYPARGVNPENLVSYPPKLEPIPVKPLFFDAAWNYIDYPGREVENVVETTAKVAAPAKGAEQTTQQKKGWFGFGR
jgi:signal recognition particle subunit SRP68